MSQATAGQRSKRVSLLLGVAPVEIPAVLSRISESKAAVRYLVDELHMVQQAREFLYSSDLSSQTMFL